MKSKTLVSYILLVNILFFITSKKAGFKARRRHKISPNNIYYKFTIGLVEQMAGNQKDIESCIPADWKTEASTDAKTSTPALEGSGGVLGYILKFLGTAIDVACKFKNDVKDYFKKKAGVRRYRRVFIQLKKVHGLRNPFDDIVAKVKELYQKIKDLLNSPLVKKTIEFIKCIKTAKTAVVGLINTVTNFIAKISKMVSGLAGFIEVAVDLICKWKDFRDAITYLKNGLKATDNLAKWNNFGQFVGKLIHTIGS